MRYKNKTKSIRIVFRLIVGLATILFVLSFTNALNAEDVTSHKGRFWNWTVKPVECGDELEYGYFELTGDLNCNGEEPAIEITGPARLNLNGYTLSGNEPDTEFENVCIQIKGEGARVWNGTVENCKEGIDIKPESVRNRITRVKSCNNDRRGFRIRGDKNLLFNCSATNNGRKGFSIEGDEDDDEKANDNLLVGCSATNNGHQGFIIEIGDGNKISYSKAYDNCRDGIEIDGGSGNRIINNIVEDNGNEEACDGDFSPWSYAGIDVTAGSEKNPSEYNEIKYNRACGNLGCNDDGCLPRERNYWNESCDSTNEWKANTVCPECTPGPLD
jgi:parallel beta-helix repeat protein